MTRTHKAFAGLKIVLLVFVLSLFFIACKKRKAFNAEDGQSLVDVTDIRAQSDLVLTDANEIISNQFFLRGKSSSENGLSAAFCGISLDSSLIYNGKLIFNYNGTICNNLKREGQVVVSIQNYPSKKWKDKGAVLQITFADYVATNSADNRSVKINGTMSVTNMSGGTYYELRYLNQSSLVQSVSALSLDVVFDNIGFVKANMERRVTFTLQGSTIAAMDEGTASQGNDANVDCWGIDRSEKVFTNLITTNVLWNNMCGPTRIKGGAVTLKKTDTYFDLHGVYGTDVDGKVTGGNDCPYGWKMDWTLRNRTKHRVFNY